jgi:hypothetical protein
MSSLARANQIQQAATMVRHVATIIQHLGHQKIHTQAVSDTIQAVSQKITNDLAKISDGIQTNAKLLEATATNYTRITNDAVEINKNLANTCSRLSQTTPDQPLAGTRPSYSQAAASQRKPQDSLTQIIQNKQGIQHRQFVISFKPEATDTPADASELTNTKIRTDMDNALRKATENVEVRAEIRTAKVLSNGRILIELKEAEGAKWLREGQNREITAKLFNPNCFFADRPYPLICRFVPVSFDPTKADSLRDLEAAHDLPSKSITGASWIKDPARRGARQEVANLKLNCSTPEAANKLLTSVIRIDNKIVSIQKEMKEPARCNKCQTYGHFARECKASKDTCAQCGGDHRTSGCTQEDRWCVPCAVATHSSNSRTCPQFVRRLGILNTRNPEYALPFYQTNEEWTWEQPRPPKPFPNQLLASTFSHHHYRPPRHPLSTPHHSAGRMVQSSLNNYFTQNQDTTEAVQNYWRSGDLGEDNQETPRFHSTPLPTDIPSHHHPSRRHLLPMNPTPSIAPNSPLGYSPPNLENSRANTPHASTSSTAPSSRHSHHSDTHTTPFTTLQSNQANLSPANAEQ